MSTQSGSAWDDLQAGQDIFGSAKALNSAYAGINNVGDIRNRFGIKDTAASFQPLYKMLSQNRSRNMAGSLLRAGRSASPEMTFSNVEGNYETGLNSLMGQQGQADIQNQQFMAQLLNSIYGARDQYGLNKAGLLNTINNANFGNRIGLDEFNMRHKNPTFWDVLGTFLGEGSKVAGAALGAPKTNNFYKFGGTGGNG